MTVIHMDVEQVQQTSSKMKAVIEGFQHKLEANRRQLRNLSSFWEGGASLETQQQGLKVLNSLEETIFILEHLKIALDHEIDQWIAVDRNGQNALILDHASVAVVGGVAIGIASIIGIGKILYDALFRKYSIEEVFTNELLNSEIGKKLIEDARNAGIALKLPNGEIVGDPNGRIIPVVYGDTGGFDGLYRMNPDGDWATDDQIIIIDNSLITSDPETIAATIAHETQHAIDDKNGLFNNRGPSFELAKEDPDAYCSQMEEYLNQFVDSEVRAYARGDAVKNNREFVDDGITTAAERKYVIEKKGYDEIYENQINPKLEEQGLAMSVIVDGEGNLKVILAEI